jgi:hypothetical protein
MKIPWTNNDVIATHGLECIKQSKAHLDASDAAWNKANDMFFRGDEMRPFLSEYLVGNARRLRDFYAKMKKDVKKLLDPRSNHSAKDSVLPTAVQVMKEILKDIEGAKASKAVIKKRKSDDNQIMEGISDELLGNREGPNAKSKHQRLKTLDGNITGTEGNVSRSSKPRVPTFEETLLTWVKPAEAKINHKMIMQSWIQEKSKTVQELKTVCRNEDERTILHELGLPALIDMYVPMAFDDGRVNLQFWHSAMGELGLSVITRMKLWTELGLWASAAVSVQLARDEITPVRMDPLGSGNTQTTSQSSGGVQPFRGESQGGLTSALGTLFDNDESAVEIGTPNASDDDSDF